MAIITISRGSMSGGEVLAQCLSTNLDYPIIGREVLVAAAEKLGISEETLAQKFQRGPGLWERLTSNRRFYVVAVQASLAEHAASGDLVYHGLAGHLLLHDIPNILRVRLIAPLEMRLKAVMERQHMTRDAAAEYIHHVDEDRVNWTKFIYGVDWRDPAQYDMVINLERMSVPTTCSMITSAVSQNEFTVNDQSRQTLADFLLECRVKLALVVNVRTRDITFKIKANRGTVEITGDIPHVGMLAKMQKREEEEILHTVQAVDGVNSVLMNL